MRWPWFSVIRLDSTFPNCGCCGARVDVLPAVGLEECGLDRPRLGLVDRAAARRREVARVGLGLRLQDAVHRGDQLDELVDRPVALLRRQSGVVAHPLELVEDRVLAFLLPVVEEHVLEQLGELGVGLDALAVVELGEQLDVQRQRQHRPGALAEHGAGDVVGVDVEAVAVGQHVADHRVDAAEQRLVLQLLVAEPHQRLERNLVAEPVVVAQFEHLGVDEALDQPEDVGVGAALDLADEPLFIGRQGRERVGERKPVRKELVGGIEAAPPDDVLVDVPAHPLGRLERSAHTGRCQRFCLIAFIVRLLSGVVCRQNGRTGRLMRPSVSRQAVEGL